MKENTTTDVVSFSREYLVALRRRLESRPRSKPASADGMGRKALSMGLGTLALARIHEEALIALVPLKSSGRNRDRMINQAEAFFMEVLTPIEKTHEASKDVKRELALASLALAERNTQLASSNRKLRHEIAKRRAMEQALRKSKEHYSLLLKQAHQTQKRLQYLSHQFLRAQEEERKKISRELHDEIAQALSGIHLHLAALDAAANINTKELKRRIASTQRLVEESVASVHRFALELRPSVLDDLGLVPALRSHIKRFKERTGIPVRLVATPTAEIKHLDGLKQTVLYRVAQEALANVAKHGEASSVRVSLRKTQDAMCLEIADDGRSFDVARVLSSKGRRGLGLIGMRERVEMVGGSFAIDSTPKKGTAIRTEIPLGGP